MKPNPGGTLSGKAIIDREEEINRIWSDLENQSVVLYSQRRVGKTSILTKMEENPKNSWFPVKYIIESKYHPIEFIEGLYDLLIKKGIRKGKFNHLKKRWKKYFDGNQIGNFKLPQIRENWKVLFEDLIEDIVKSDKKVLLMFDELPNMIDNFKISEECGPVVCMEFLGLLRDLRNKHESSGKIAYIFSGSLGLNLVIYDLIENHGYVGDPLNNMAIHILNGMNDSGARELCDELSENHVFNDKGKILSYLCECTDNLPFYIQHIFKWIDENHNNKITKKTIDDALDSLLNNPEDMCFFKHYVSRIEKYYNEQDKELSFIILDDICKTANYKSEATILNVVKNKLTASNKNVKRALDLLWNDHYLSRELKEENRTYKMKYTIIRKWWKINRS